jgi:hypothetical protein
MGCGLSKSEQTSDKTVSNKQNVVVPKVPGSPKELPSDKKIVTSQRKLTGGSACPHFSTGDLTKDADADATDSTDVLKCLDSGMKEANMGGHRSSVNLKNV